jgi:2-(1,2-epoxy-1,2-dihydrophenyl)acetyl-CoA isomerase
MTSPLRLHIEHGLATMTFCAPERANVLDLAMARAFAAAVQQIASDDSVRAILITGEGMCSRNCSTRCLRA